jgi:hypothetical protein
MLVVVEEPGGVDLRIDPHPHHYDEAGHGLRHRFGEGRDSQQACGERCIAHELFFREDALISTTHLALRQDGGNE